MWKKTMVNIEERYIGKDKLELRVTENPKLYGFIEPFEDKSRPFILKYFYNDKYQDCDFADDMTEGKERLGKILTILYNNMNESRLFRFNNFLNEGKYDSMVGILVDDILQEIKDSREEWDGEDEYENEENKHIASYSGTMEEVDLYLNLRRTTTNDDYFDDIDFKTFKDNGFFMEGYCFNEEEELFKDEDFDLSMFDMSAEDGSLTINLIIDPTREPEIYSDIVKDLHDTIRHELEHLTQSGKNKLPGKVGITTRELRDKIKNSDRLYLYYLLKDELPALVRGMYKQATFEKKPLDDIFNQRLDELETREVVNSDDRIKLMRVWSNYAKKHLPKAKWN